ncbi:hypothetical protein V2590_14690, partial [Tenacibaculum maritimum]|uniref:hypothetical protein n=1 Tax=Tenacibaculum maritimum TaxID=107401 RepID=UPI003875F76A
PRSYKRATSSAQTYWGLVIFWYKNKQEVFHQKFGNNNGIFKKNYNSKTKGNKKGIYREQ